MQMRESLKTLVFIWAARGVAGLAFDTGWGTTGTIMEDRDYFYRRAETELHMAQAATVPEAVKAHYQLAGYYLDRVYGETRDRLEQPLL